jgi:hypothetical protein
VALTVGIAGASQVHALESDSAAVGATMDEASYGSGIVMSPDSMDVAVSLDTVTLAQAHGFVVDDADIALTFDVAATAQAHLLEIAAMSVELSIDGASFGGTPRPRKIVRLPAQAILVGKARAHSKVLWIETARPNKDGSKAVIPGGPSKAS